MLGQFVAGRKPAGPARSRIEAKLIEARRRGCVEMQPGLADGHGVAADDMGDAGNLGGASDVLRGEHNRDSGQSSLQHRGSRVGVDTPRRTAVLRAGRMLLKSVVQVS